MTIKIFNNKKIIIREAERGDIKKVEKFQHLVNSLVKEDAKISINKKLTLREEKEFLEKALQSIKDKKKIYLLAECDNKIVGAASIELDKLRRSHVGTFGIIIAKEYRGIGLGKYMMREVIEIAERKLIPKPKIIQLSVCANNKPAINLYKKIGFKIVAKIPKQIQWKGKLIDELVMIKK